jgi:GNAT superfamily N-acetyltransferase
MTPERLGFARLRWVARSSRACEARLDVTLHFPTRAEQPGKLPHAASLHAAPNPAFLNEVDVLKRLFGRVVTEYPEFLFYAWDDEREEVVGVGHAIPAAWDGDTASLHEGWDAVIEARFAPEPPTPTVLCALGITIADEWRGQGLSCSMIERMGEIGRDHGLATLIAPVRPTLKHRYPLTPIDRYIDWRRQDGSHLDPWLRTHERLGATIVKAAPESTVTTGTVTEWEEWTEMALPESGTYVVPGALAPIKIDRERNEGTYVEPNVWMVHPGD